MDPTVELIVRLVGTDAQPVALAGVEVDIRFYVHGNTRYTFTLGCTDDSGAVHTQLGNIERQLEENRRFFLMDYNTPLDECDSAVGIIIPSVDDLAEREAAKQKWWPDRKAAPETSNGRVRCREQKFQLSMTEPNKFDLICEG